MKKTISIYCAVAVASAFFAGCTINGSDNDDIVNALYVTAAQTKKVDVVNALAKPEVFATVDNSGVVMLKWNPVSGATGYYVYKKADEDQAWVAQNSSSTNTYVTTCPTANKKYNFRIDAISGVESASSTEVTVTTPETLSAITALDANSVEVKLNATYANKVDVKFKPNPAANYAIYISENTGDALLNVEKKLNSSSVTVKGIEKANVKDSKVVAGSTTQSIAVNNIDKVTDVVATIVETPVSSVYPAVNRIISTQKVILKPLAVSYRDSTPDVTRTSATSARVRFAVNKKGGAVVEAVYDIFRKTVQDGVESAFAKVGTAALTSDAGDYVDYAFDDTNIADVNNTNKISAYKYIVVANINDSLVTTNEATLDVLTAGNPSATSTDYSVLDNGMTANITGVTERLGSGGNLYPVNKVDLTVSYSEGAQFKAYVADFQTLAAATKALESEINTDITAKFNKVDSTEVPAVSTTTTDGVSNATAKYVTYEAKNYELGDGVLMTYTAKYKADRSLVNSDFVITNKGKFYVFKFVSTKAGQKDNVQTKIVYVTKIVNNVTVDGKDASPSSPFYAVTIQ